MQEAELNILFRSCKNKSMELKFNEIMNTKKELEGVIN